MPTNNKPNSLITEKSPYLLQHAHNPVDWFPWGEEAFEKAKRENKPVLISIGYSTCHWCHVMAHESFEDEEIAGILNDKFIAIKVDREERPDVDSVYMRICQLMTGQGGWPLNVFVTPDQKPFYAGTYFPKTSKFNRPGFIDVLEHLSETFANDRQHVEDIAENAAAHLEVKVHPTEGMLGEQAVHDTYRQLAGGFDTVYGGFGQAPKFPMPHMLLFLLRYYSYTGKEQALAGVTKTLDGMANGGIFDHIGFGFARYSTDNEWLVPHFEKMLYDNALLLSAYTEAYQVTNNERYKQIATQIVTFIKREMMHEDGSFFSALDADTEGREGKYYIWSKKEIMNLLGDDLGSLYCKVYNITEQGNFEGENIPNLIFTRREAILEETGLTEHELTERLEGARKKLLEARENRSYPHTDDKVLTSWNALMIAGLAKAAKVFHEPDFLNMAETAIRFLERHLIPDGRVMVRYREGEVKNKGFIDDYAFLIWAYLELYEASFNPSYLKKAKMLCTSMLDLFWDERNGGFFFTGNDAETLLVREKEVYDGAVPSGNSAAAVQLLRLGRLTGDVSLIEKAEAMFSVFKREIEAYPSSSAFFMQSVLTHIMPQKEIVVFGSKDDPDRKRFIEALQEHFTTAYTILAAEHPEELAGISDFAAGYQMIDGKTTVYICENFTCRRPTTDIDEAMNVLQISSRA
ncbi:thioredoxin domain-containing protein [Bacillus amyloliquefaciens]|uniref:thioredoxin domain-containing protein n=1 Tax=Bacillus amyloliquefaciens TaxID=1390 RepID=UPI0008247B08|nr:thioredoxin domain-containing protein [Bacillus amyloliquefaciens]AOC93132.1 Spermatoproteinis-associated protein [Bacillus amyloliquefaciens]